MEAARWHLILRGLNTAALASPGPVQWPGPGRFSVVRLPFTVILRGRERGGRKGDIREWVRGQPEPGLQRTRRQPEPGSPGRTVHRDLSLLPVS